MREFQNGGRLVSHLCVTDGQTVEQIEKDYGHEENEQKEDNVAREGPSEVNVSSIKFASQHDDCFDDGCERIHKLVELAVLALFASIISVSCRRSFHVDATEEDVEAQAERDDENRVESEALQERG